MSLNIPNQHVQQQKPQHGWWKMAKTRNEIHCLRCMAKHQQAAKRAAMTICWWQQRSCSTQTLPPGLMRLSSLLLYYCTHWSGKTGSGVPARAQIWDQIWIWCDEYDAQRHAGFSTTLCASAFRAWFLWWSRPSHTRKLPTTLQNLKVLLYGRSQCCLCYSCLVLVLHVAICLFRMRHVCASFIWRLNISQVSRMLEV